MLWAVWSSFCPHWAYGWEEAGAQTLCNTVGQGVLRAIMREREELWGPSRMWDYFHVVEVSQGYQPKCLCPQGEPWPPPSSPGGSPRPQAFRVRRRMWRLFLVHNFYLTYWVFLLLKTGVLRLHKPGCPLPSLRFSLLRPCHCVFIPLAVFLSQHGAWEWHQHEVRSWASLREPQHLST